MLTDQSLDIRIRKASQMGASTFCLLRSFWMCKTKLTPRGLIYWLPTSEVVGDFVNTKIDPFISENPELMSAKSIDKGKLTDNQGLKFMYGVPFFVRGLKSKTKVKTISADGAIYDEFDEADPAQVTQARKRLSASNIKASIDLSTPTIPDFGIDRRFQETDQRHYCFKCESCSKWNVLEEHFPNNFFQERDGSYFIGCYSCKSKLNVKQGTWFKLNTDSQISGYQISQLYSPFVSPNEIMHEFQTTEFMAHFYNHVLGLPYLSSTDRVTMEMVLSLCDNMRVINTFHKEQTVMGVDVGSKLHCTALRPGNPHRVVWMGELKNFEELDSLMLKLNCKDIVFDALPETRKVREFIERHKTKAWMCFYNDNQKGEYAWKEDQRMVQVNRTESLDVGTLAIIKKNLILPQRNELVEEFARHCANIVKTVEEDREKGDKKFVYKKIGPDHFRHSLNYAMIAASRSRFSGVFSAFR